MDSEKEIKKPKINSEKLLHSNSEFNIMNSESKTTT